MFDPSYTKTAFNEGPSNIPNQKLNTPKLERASTRAPNLDAKLDNFLVSLALEQLLLLQDMICERIENLEIRHTYGN